MRLNVDPLLQVMDRDDLWRHVGLPRREFRTIVETVSAHHVELARLAQGDPVRLLEAAVQYANNLLDNSKKLAEVEVMLRELKETEDWLSTHERSFFNKREENRLFQMKEKQMGVLMRRFKDYLFALDYPIESHECSYGRCLGIYQNLDLKIIQGRCKMIADTLMQLKGMLPAKA